MPRMIDDETWFRILCLMKFDKWDMSNKELFDSMESAPSVDLLDLERVERYRETSTDGMIANERGYWVRFSDLQSLVTLKELK